MRLFQRAYTQAVGPKVFPPLVMSHRTHQVLQVPFHAPRPGVLLVLHYHPRNPLRLIAKGQSRFVVLRNIGSVHQSKRTLRRHGNYSCGDDSKCTYHIASQP
jgi:hypothetical protein